MPLITADRVLETTVTTGTADLALTGTLTGYRAFSAVCTNTDTVYYTLWEVDSAGLPNGAWETGLGTWVTGNTLQRTTVHASSAANAKVTLAAGTKRVALGLTAAALAGFQTALVSGTNIKTVNGSTLLGSGDLVVQGGINYARHTSAVTAADKSGIIADTSGGSFTVTLPSAPSTGAQVSIVDGANWSTNNLTVGRNGSTIEGLTEDLVLDVGGTSVHLIYDGTTWEVFSQAGVFSSDIVTGQASSVDNEIALFSGTTGKVIKRATTTGMLRATSGVIAAASAGTDYVAPTGSDGTITRHMLKDTGMVFFDSGTTNALDYTNGSCQRWAPNTGAQTLSITNWPPTGNLGELLIQGVNLGAATITWPTINWVKSDGTTTTTFSSNGVTLQSSGTDWVLLWTRDAGTTIFGKVVR